MNFLLFLGVFISGGAGAWLRFTLDGAAKKTTLGQRVPLGTFLINFTGSFLLGALTGATGMLAGLFGDDIVHTFVLLAGTGFLGGFTTFSTAMVDAVTAASARRPGVFIFAWLAQAILCIVAAALGMGLTA
ncbi:fluoride efflux transporter FluC [Rothia amarae]|uniref:fluoride efflux transporter FluC n=1 Tax=Rothia amarae TaxID=169480 RepID=UPI0031D15AAA